LKLAFQEMTKSKVVFLPDFTMQVDNYWSCL
jgi:hypothetical protein